MSMSLEGLACGLIVGLAVMTGVARDMMCCRDPITHLELFHSLSYFHNLTCDLVAQDQRNLVLPVPEHDIASANS